MPHLEAFCQQHGIGLSPRQVERFVAFREALYEANRTRNLTRIRFEDCELLHFVDSLLVAEFIPTGAQVLDIGTGPGFPAWPLACTRPDLEVTALDSSSKMLGFLETQPLSNLRVVRVRAEEWNELERFDFVTGRAVAPLAAQLEVSARPCRIGGLVVPFRTPSDEGLLATAAPKGLGLKLERVERRLLPVVEAERMFPIYVKVAPTRRSYPRPWSKIRAGR